MPLGVVGIMCLTWPSVSVCIGTYVLCKHMYVHACTVYWRAMEAFCGWIAVKFSSFHCEIQTTPGSSD